MMGSLFNYADPNSLVSRLLLSFLLQTQSPETPGASFCRLGIILCVAARERDTGSIRYVGVRRRPQPGAVGCIVDRLGIRLPAGSVHVVSIVIPVTVGSELLVGRAGIRCASREQDAGSNK